MAGSPAEEAAAAAARADKIRQRDNTKTYTNVDHFLNGPPPIRRVEETLFQRI